MMHQETNDDDDDDVAEDDEHNHNDDDHAKRGNHESRLGLEEGPPPSQGDRYSRLDNPEFVLHHHHYHHYITMRQGKPP